MVIQTQNTKSPIRYSKGGALTPTPFLQCITFVVNERWIQSEFLRYS